MKNRPGATSGDARAVPQGAAQPEDSDSGPHRRSPLRRCIVTRESQPAERLIRFVHAPDGTVVPDLAGKLPGRGAWVTARRDAVAEAVRKRLFGRALKSEVTAAADLADQVEALMRRRALGALGLARKAGLVVLGFAKVDAAIARSEPAGLVIAADARPDGARKIRQALAARYRTAAIPVIDFFASAELDLALGRPNVIHAALLAGQASGGFLSRAQALANYGGAGPDLAGPTGPSSDLGDDELQAAGVPQS